MTSRQARTHVMIGDTPTYSPRPQHLTKQEFARRLYKLMRSKGWRASELARQAGLERAAVSTYMNAHSMPSAASLNKLANALDTTPEDLLPNTVESAIDEDIPAFEIKASVSAPGAAWLRVNRLVTMSTAVKIAALLDEDNVDDKPPHIHKSRKRKNENN